MKIQSKGQGFKNMADIQAESQVVLGSIKKRELQQSFHQCLPLLEGLLGAVYKV
jgi:hypothetical protein